MATIPFSVGAVCFPVQWITASFTLYPLPCPECCSAGGRGLFRESRRVETSPGANSTKINAAQDQLSTGPTQHRTNSAQDQCSTGPTQHSETTEGGIVV
ncbi:MAG: hypothetical protein CBB71_07805 [Rhodopirellula sp. TMED11]|nr:MAG: hypothetical protein CBB71_07805 [Rhodopirellula sp. TMED11]